jgi:AMMECR1 domain-containing protein
MKAGLPPDTWLTKGTKIYKFKGIIFEEQAPQGAVRRKALKEE